MRRVTANLLADRGAIYVRGSKHPDGPALGIPVAHWETFVLGAKQGDFDH